MKALIIEGSPDTICPSIIHIQAGTVDFTPASSLAGTGTYETARQLRQAYGDQAAVLLIGPAGERQLRGAGIHALDVDGRPSRIHARGGLGALMGSKGIKAIIIEGNPALKPAVADPDRYRRVQKQYLQALLAHPQTTIYREFSTPGILGTCNTFGALPTRNFSTGYFEAANLLSGEHFRQVVLDRAGEGGVSHHCQAGCAIRCSNVYAGPDGKEILSALEYETLGLMGSNLGISSLDSVARLNWHANDLGLDTIELGASLGLAAECGYIEFGDEAGAQHLIDEIRQNTLLGRILGNGAFITGTVLGSRRIPVAKKQAFSAYDPRAIKGSGVTYATSPQGADHTAGHTIRARIDHRDPRGQAALSRDLQIKMAGYDTLGVCIFAGFGIGSDPGLIAELLNARYGWHAGENILLELGKMTLRTEIEFNRRAGLSAVDDRLPEWVSSETLPSTGTVFDVSDSDLDGVLDW
jgi:aldehyde:ferredoxin oxidoreductase